MLKQYRSWWGAVLLLAATGSGCSAVWARTKVSDARSACEAAQEVGAEKKAPYEYAAAVLYLEKAREEEAYSHFGPAIDLGETSSDYAEKAKAIATGNAPPEPAQAASQPKP